MAEDLRFAWLRHCHVCPRKLSVRAYRDRFRPTLEFLWKSHNQIMQAVLPFCMSLVGACSSMCLLLNSIVVRNSNPLTAQNQNNSRSLLTLYTLWPWGKRSAGRMQLPCLAAVIFWGLLELPCLWNRYEKKWLYHHKSRMRLWYFRKIRGMP